jgi:hypothetical protein
MGVRVGNQTGRSGAKFTETMLTVTKIMFEEIR